MDIFITPDNFEKHIRFIVSNFECISIKNLFTSTTPGKIRVLITLDDGYKGNYEYAFPILKKYQCPATVFITTGFINRTSFPWRAGLHYLLHIHGKETVINKLKAFNIEIPDNQDLLKWTKEQFSVNLYNAIQSIIEKEPEAKILLDSFLSWEQIKIMQQSGLISFGLHGVTHQIMSKLSSTEQLPEIVNGIESFRTKLNIAPDGFAYPFGGKEHFNQDTIDILSEYLPDNPAFNLGSGFNSIKKLNNHFIQRLCVHDWTSSELSHRMLLKYLKRS
jgi:peptidoglycan/xylan/chitin deacetylase (PgdA/CDA1 family)